MTAGAIPSSAQIREAGERTRRGPTTKEVLEGYRQRSWRFLADLQTSSGQEFVVGRREGPYIWSLEGDRRVLECGNSGGVHSLGHRNPEIVATLEDALEHLDAGMWTMPTPEALVLGDAIAGSAPTPQLNRSVPTLSSSISIDLAIMFAFRVTGRGKILAFRHGYHGSSGLAALATGSDAEGWFDHYRLPRDQSLFFPTYGDLAGAERCVSDECAAVIAEPMNYETFAPAPPDFLPGLAEVCRRRGVLFIMDETRTGLGRSGKTWMTSHYEVAPDMLIVGKGLGGGMYPASALLATESIYDACMNTERWGYMASMAGSPIGALVATKVVEIASRPSLLANVQNLGEALEIRFAEIAERYPQVFSRGSVLGAIATLGLANQKIVSSIRRELFARNVLCHSVSEIAPRVVKFFPCLTSGEEVVEELTQALSDVGESYARGRARSQ
ncbi:MAG TPA: aminotransferase class III-fold pyridoxal phosphate-dependent enzyme [Caulobacteraceae bacterium]|nr:aminotransferase class III-fold pyridoxal phosphate-dependent enzyme [Caulobacteraceae bacterium]